jgi:hypothetical protein
MGALGLLKPFARTARLRLLKRRAEQLVKKPVAAERGENSDLAPPAFIFACGRSGTTILGKLFGLHEGVTYLREPYHLWATIEPALDVTNLHVRTPPRLWWGQSDVTDPIRTRFARLILGERERSGRPILIEKTPHNVFRIGFLDELTGGRGRFIHIVRNGIDVARSIDRLATNQLYTMAGRRDYNQWWGSNELMWQRLAAEGPAHGHFTALEVAQLTSHAQRGAYEWLASLGEADRWRAALGDRLLEITYQWLTRDTRGVLTRLAAHVGATAPEPWLAAADAMVSPERKNKGGELRLPANMARLFNEYQGRYGYENRAVALD